MILKQQAEAKYSSRRYNRCKICGRPHAYLRDYGVCRICFRELAYKGQLPGVRKEPFHQGLYNFCEQRFRDCPRVWFLICYRLA